MTRYLNTDLDLGSPTDLAPLVAAFEAAGVAPLHVTHEDALWRATLETDEQHDDPETNIQAILAVVEGLSAADRQIWDACSERELNIGYEQGVPARALYQGLSSDLLGRIAAIGASLRLTIYPAP